MIARGDAWLREALDRPQNREILDGAVRQVWGAGGRWHIVEETATARAAAPVVMAPAPMLDHPVVQSALDIFAGTIETIEEQLASGGAMNLQKLMKQAQEMQDRLQGELETLEVEAAVGGGMVAVT